MKLCRNFPHKLAAYDATLRLSQIKNRSPENESRGGVLNFLERGDSITKRATTNDEAQGAVAM